MSEVKILLAEDNCDHQELLLLGLVRGRPHVNVTVVSKGSDFIRAVAQRRYDCVILDYNLPDYKAPELLKEASEVLEGCPALVISSSRGQEVVIESIRSGSVDFVPKFEAIEDNVLWQRVEACILKAKRLRSERRRTERRERLLARMSETDHLTGLNNRRYLDRCLIQRVWERDRRVNAAAMMVDVDHFKMVNDRHGHAAGDQVLKAVAAILREVFSDARATVRYGGEEFLIVVDIPSLTEAWQRAEKLRRRIEQATVSTGRGDLKVTASVGIAVSDGEPVSTGTIDKADEALYLAKLQGCNRIATWPMVAIEGHLRQISGVDGMSPEQRRLAFLERCGYLLGPTQWEHLTTHADHVSEIAGQINRAMRLEPAVGERVLSAALLHDIGKSAIPEALLSQPRSLSYEEWKLISLHSELGAWIASRLGADQETVDMVRHHHTPYTLKTAEQDPQCVAPIGARVICVADALVTMMTERSYQRRLTADEAMRELRRHRGEQFDPRVVDAAQLTRPIQLREAA